MLHCGLLSAYIWCEFIIYAVTVLIILLGYSWGSLPHRYLNAVRKIQDVFQNVYQEEWVHDPWSEMIDTTRINLLHHVGNHLTGDFEIVKNPETQLFESQLDLTQAGLQAIIQDDVSSMFTLNPNADKFELTKALWSKITNKPHLKALYVGSIAFRYGILFPVRLALYLTSFLYVSICCILACLVKLSNQQKTAIAVTYCRLYTAGIGLIARYHNPQNQPKRPGVAVSNHLSPNDIQIICADVDPNRDYLYIVTGQKHTGIIWAIERLVEQLCPSMWLERTNPDERLKFQQEVLRTARTSGPVLIFPEGYCTNNTKVLQFRKAVFGEHVQIHPIAIKQDARYGDAYWCENFFGHYLIRLLTNWATVYDISYLPPQIRNPNETAEQFAARIQHLISDAIGAKSSLYDGGMFYKPAIREKYKLAVQKLYGNHLQNHYVSSSSDMYLSSSSGEK